MFVLVTVASGYVDIKPTEYNIPLTFYLIPISVIVMVNLSISWNSYSAGASWKRPFSTGSRLILLTLATVWTICSIFILLICG